MENKHLTSQEKEALLTQEGAYSAVMGYLMAERGKIAPAVFNKHVAELGYLKLNRDDLIDFAKVMDEDEVLSSLYNKAKARTIKLDEIPNGIGDTEDLTESDLFNLVTNYLVDNEENNARLREMRHLQRKGVYMKQLMDGLKKYLVDELKGMPRMKFLTTPVAPPQKGDKSIILIVSDWHIGAVVHNPDTGGYNFKKLSLQVDNMINVLLELIEDLDIKHVYVFHAGDTIEHINMRNVNQAFESEFIAVQQIAKAYRLIIDLLIKLSARVHVTFGAVAGNHDRFQGNKNDKIYNDTVTYILVDILDMLQDTFGQLPNVTLIDNREDTYEFTVKVAGKRIKVKHGDHEKKKDDQKIPKHIKEEPIDYFIMGHIHTSRFVQEDYHRFHVYAGSPMGANGFSKELELPTTTASQLVMVLTEGSNTPYFIPLMFDKEGNL
jgi:predicted phosphodiesterase